MPPTYDQGIIYRITSPSGNAYVGQTRLPLKKRMAAHFSKRSNSILLKRAIRKYGKDQMKVDILWKGPVDQLDQQEKHFILKYKTFTHGYNCTSGGESGKNLSENTKQRISAGMKQMYRQHPEYRRQVKQRLLTYSRNARRFRGSQRIRGWRTGCVRLYPRTTPDGWVHISYRALGPYPKRTSLGYFTTPAKAEAAVAKYKEAHPEEFT